MCFLVIQNLKNLINSKNLSTTVGDEGGFAPALNKNEDAIDFIIKSIEKSGFKPGKDISICLDVASNELFKDGKYSVNEIKKGLVYIEASRLGRESIIIEYNIDKNKAFPTKL
jgi:enolase